jgi:hypothetical protein
MNIDDLFKFDVSSSKDDVKKDKIGTSYSLRLKPKLDNVIAYYVYSFEYRMMATKVSKNKFILSNAEEIIFGPFGYVGSKKIDLEDTLMKYNEGSLHYAMVAS